MTNKKNKIERGKRDSLANSPNNILHLGNYKKKMKSQIAQNILIYELNDMRR